MLLTLLSSLQLKHLIFDGKFTTEFDLAVVIMLAVSPIIEEDLYQQTSEENISFW